MTRIIRSSRREKPGRLPRGALALATVAVSLLCLVYLMTATNVWQAKKAFQAYSTRDYVPPPKAHRRFSQHVWGFATNAVMESIDHLTAKQWKKTFAWAEEFKGAYHPLPTLDAMVAQMRYPSGRAKCIE